jgi:hypothetical protein
MTLEGSGNLNPSALGEFGQPCGVGRMTDGTRQKHEPEVRKIAPRAPSELEQAIRRVVRKHIGNPNEVPWLVATGAEAASD